MRLYFGNKLFRGNRTSKLDALNFNAFDSPNMAPLVTVGVNIGMFSSSPATHAVQLTPSNVVACHRGELDQHAPPRTAGTIPCAHKTMNPNVATLRLFPGTTRTAIHAFLSPPMVGVVLETYGAGYIPDTREDLIEELSEASSRGVVIVNCSQCKKGLVLDAYAATSRPLLAAGLIPGRDMTAEVRTPHPCDASAREVFWD